MSDTPLKKDQTSPAQHIAQVMAARWNAVATQISAADLSAVKSALLNLGAGAWTWWHLKDSTDLSAALAAELQQSYRLHTLQVAVKELEVSTLFAYLQACGLDPLMGKGWAIARHYPEPGLRPFGDIDLYVDVNEYKQYQSALQSEAAPRCIVDLHRGAAELDDRDFAALYEHSQQIRVNNQPVRVFGAEDHLRLLCLHFLREGAMRPLWLCDIAIAIEKIGNTFDWDYFLSGDPRRTEWTLCTIGLAHHLLGVAIQSLPIAAQAMALPDWLLAETLKVWGGNKIPHGRRRSMASYLHQPNGMLSALLERWPNGIAATIGTRGAFNNWPRLPYQLGECLLRTTTFARKLPDYLNKNA